MTEEQYEMRRRRAVDEAKTALVEIRSASLERSNDGTWTVVEAFGSYSDGTQINLTLRMHGQSQDYALGSQLVVAIGHMEW